MKEGGRYDTLENGIEEEKNRMDEDCDRAGGTEILLLEVSYQGCISIAAEKIIRVS